MHEPSHSIDSLIYLPIFIALFYVLPAICLQRIAHKGRVEGGWLAWIPMARWALCCRMGGISSWWILLTLIPFVGVLMSFLLLAQVPRCLGINGPARYLMLIPILNLLYLTDLAISYTPEVTEEGNIKGAPKPRKYGSSTNIATALCCAFISPVFLGFLVVLALPAFNRVRDVSQTNMVTNNLRHIALSADQYFAASDDFVTSYKDLVRSNPALAELRPVAGENYAKAFPVIYRDQHQYRILVPGLRKEIVYEERAAPPPQQDIPSDRLEK